MIKRIPLWAHRKTNSIQSSDRILYEALAYMRFTCIIYIGTYLDLHKKKLLFYDAKNLL